MPFLLYILLNNLKEEIHIPYGQIQLTKGYFNSLKKFKAKKKKFIKRISRLRGWTGGISKIFHCNVHMELYVIQFNFGICTKQLVFT